MLSSVLITGERERRSKHGKGAEKLELSDAGSTNINQFCPFVKQRTSDGMSLDGLRSEKEAGVARTKWAVGMLTQTDQRALALELQGSHLKTHAAPLLHP